MASAVALPAIQPLNGGPNRRRHHRPPPLQTSSTSSSSSSYSYSSPSTHPGRLKDHYRTLRVQPGASERDIKKAFRELALQYHPDVCKGGDCGVEFHQINEAYDMIMESLRAGEEWCGGVEEEMEGMGDTSWDLWEEWMGWEGAGIRDYSSHINPYI
ncbi:chaperone DnaJ-domain superfamily protein [Wolffia australiana]